jgi:hypothetical protein
MTEINFNIVPDPDGTDSYEIRFTGLTGAELGAAAGLLAELYRSRQRAAPENPRLKRASVTEHVSVPPGAIVGAHPYRHIDDHCERSNPEDALLRPNPQFVMREPGEPVTKPCPEAGPGATKTLYPFRYCAKCVTAHKCKANGACRNIPGQL